LLDTPYPFVGVVWGSIETPDSGFILMHTSFDIFQDTNQIKIVKVDKTGEILWTKNYGAAGTAHEQYEIIRTADSCYVFCGLEWKNDTASAMLFKINENGDSLWMKTYNSGYYLGVFGKVIETSNKDLICIGGYDKTPVGGPDPWRQIFIVRTDKDGNLRWHRNYGSSSLNNNGRDIVETPEHEFICSGYIRSPYAASSQFFVDALLMKIDSLGNEIWVQQYSEFNIWQALVEINQTLDGNYLATGDFTNNYYINTNDPYGAGGILLKIDAAGNTLWFKRYGDEILDAGCYDFVELPDSSFVTVGMSYRPHTKAKMVKFNNQGEITAVFPFNYNSTDFGEELFTILHTKDNGFLMTGDGAPYDTINPLLVSKGWILKVDSLGCQIPFCVVDTDEPRAPNPPQGLQLLPNPSSGVVEVRWTGAEGGGTLEVFQLNGVLLLRQNVSLPSGSSTISLDQQPAGIYLVRLNTGASSITRKLVKE
jgi:hypothetical protein